jgi:hypothetical protein
MKSACPDFEETGGNDRGLPDYLPGRKIGANNTKLKYRKNHET